MARGLLKFGFFMYHGSKLRQKIHALSRWRSYPHIAQLFCSRRTIMARALLNFCCLDVSRTANFRDDLIWQTN